MNALAWNAGQTSPAQVLEQRYRAPALGLSQRIERGDLGLSQQEMDALRDTCDGGPGSANGQLALLSERPELAALLPPAEAAVLIRAAIAARVKLPLLLQCVG